MRTEDLRRSSNPTRQGIPRWDAPELLAAEPSADDWAALARRREPLDAAVERDDPEGVEREVEDLLRAVRDRRDALGQAPLLRVAIAGSASALRDALWPIVDNQVRWILWELGVTHRLLGDDEADEGAETGELPDPLSAAAWDHCWRQMQQSVHGVLNDWVMSDPEPDALPEWLEERSTTVYASTGSLLRGALQRAGSEWLSGFLGSDKALLLERWRGKTGRSGALLNRLDAERLAEVFVTYTRIDYDELEETDESTDEVLRGAMFRSLEPSAT